MDCWVGPRPRIPSRPALACNQPVLCRSEQFGRRGRGSLSQRIGFSLLDMFHSCSGSAKKRRQQVLVTLYAHPLIQTSPSMWVQILSPSLPLSLSPSAFFFIAANGQVAGGFGSAVSLHLAAQPAQGAKT